MTIVRQETFGALPGCAPVALFTLANVGGVEARLISFGATLVSLRTPDRAGRCADLSLGHDTVEGFINHNQPYFGSTVGRYANRIARARFALDGREYRLAAHDGANTLHGGRRGFDKVVWSAAPFEASHAAGVRFTLTSPDGEEGFPGNLEVEVAYTLTDADELRIDYRATTDRPTPVNLTHHSYFNLAGHDSGDVLDHEVEIMADRYVVVDEALIPTGELRPVKGSAMDFTSPQRIGERLVEAGGDPPGYDHTYVLRSSGKLALAARVREPKSGRMLEVETTEPGVQFYAGNHLDGSITGKNGCAYQRHAGFCLETQHYPDSPNRPEFPSTILRPGEEYRSTTVYRFSAR